MKGKTHAGSYSNRTCFDKTWIYRGMCVRNTKLHFWILPLVVILICLKLFFSSDDWIVISERASLEAEEGWIETDNIEEETVPACSLRHTLKKDVSLNNKFNFFVPVLLWRDSFNPSVWQKLQNVSLPYGWKDQDPDVIGKALTLLWHPSNSRLFERNSSHECVRCAVVGNGGILKGSGQGELIDSHDYVFRVNGAIIKGFEKDVGTKTSFYGFTFNSLKNSLNSYHAEGFRKVPNNPGIRYIFIPSQTRDYVMLAAGIQGVSVTSGIDEGDRPSEFFGDNPEFRMLHPFFLQYVTEKFLKSPQMEMHRDIYMPSTGANMLMTALHTCDQVSAFGFMTENYKDFSDHYYDSEYKELVHYANHDMMMESRLWKLLNTHKVMWLYQRTLKKG